MTGMLRGGGVAERSGRGGGGANYVAPAECYQ